MLHSNHGAHDAWVTIHRPNPQAPLRLFCFPYSGAGASIFYKWSSAFQPDVELCAVQYPGRETRLSEPPYTRLEPLIQEAAPAILPYLDRPFACFGHSIGALVSFELVRFLRREYGLRPVHLFVSGHGAPQLPDRNRPIHHLPEPEFVTELRRYNGIPEEVLAHTELRELVLPILRADFAVYETYHYVPGEPLDCPITAFGGLQDAFVSREEMEGWREQTHSSFMLTMFPGDHFFVNTGRSLLIDAVNRELARLASF